MKPRPKPPVKPPDPRDPRSDQRRAEYGLYQVAFAYVWAALRRLGLPEQDRGELAQKILHAAYEKRRDYDPVVGSPARWLHGFVVNFARRHWEQQPPQEQCSLDEVPEARLATSRPEDQGMAEEHREFLEKELLAKIPFEQRAVIIARDLDELDFKDIARLHGIPLSTAYDRYTRGHVALELLYARWKRKHDGPGVALLPLTQLFEANRAIPEAPADIEQAVWKRLQRARRWSPLVDLLKQPALRIVASMACGAALYAALQPAPRERVSIIEVPVLIATAAASEATVSIEAATPSAPAPAPVPAPRAEEIPTHAPSAGRTFRDPLEEQRMFEAAGRAYKRGNLDEALATLQRLARAYPHGRLESEREQLWIQALVRTGQSAEARARIAQLRGTAQGKALVEELDELIPDLDGGSRALPER